MIVNQFGCKFFSNLLKLIGIDGDLEVKFKKRNCGFINCWKYIQNLWGQDHKSKTAKEKERKEKNRNK